MRLNKQRKVYLGLLAVAGLALAADQLFFGVAGPQGASAAMQTPATTPTAAAATPGLPAVAANASTARIAGAARLAQLLDALARQDNLNAATTTDAFAIPQEWLPAVASDADEAENIESQQASGSDAAASPVPVVSAVMAGGARPAAIVNGRLMIVGEPVKGLMLVAVEPSVAYVRTPDGVVHEVRMKVAPEAKR
ncbi:MAG: hypothetical protein KJZ54_14145 [Phycisphaerales bacterium]|nr:hypothetical protein [Phycisphaerales bacterium]